MANEKQMDSELIEELQQRLEALNNEGVMDAGVIDGFLTAYALNPEHPSKHDIYPYIFSEEGDPAALPEDDRILELLDIRLNEIQAALAAKGGSSLASLIAALGSVALVAAALGPVVVTEA